MVNTDGHENNAIGNKAFYNNVSGSGNTAIGDGALYSNTIGSANSAFGVDAGSNLTTVITILISATEALLARPIPSG